MEVDSPWLFLKKGYPIGLTCASPQGGFNFMRLTFSPLSSARRAEEGLLVVRIDDRNRKTHGLPCQLVIAH